MILNRFAGRGIVAVLSFLSFLALNQTVLAGYIKKESVRYVPVEIKISDEVRKNWTPQEKEINEKILEVVKPFFQKLANDPEGHSLHFIDPKNFPSVKLEDLFQSPTTDEVSKLGGKDTELNEEQLNEVWQKGTFKVASQENPGVFFTWRYRVWIIKGQKAIQVTFKQDQADAKRHVEIRLPEALFSTSAKKISFPNVAINLLKGVKETLGLLVGLSETHQRYEPWEIDLLIQKLRWVFLRNQALENKVGDPRFYDNALMERAVSILEKIQADVQKAGFTNEKYFDAIETRKELEELSPGIGKILANRGRALKIIFEHERALEEQKEKFRDLKRAEIKSRYQLDGIELEERAEKAADAWYQESKWDHYKFLITALNDGGFEDEAALAHLELEHMNEASKLLRVAFEAEKEASNSFVWKARIWNPHNWEIENYGTKEEPWYSANKYKALTASSDKIGWRLKAAAYRTYAAWKNSLYWVIAANFWSGPLGVKSLLKKEPFKYYNEVDSQTGELKLSLHEVQTLQSRIKALYKSRRDLIEKYDNDNLGGLPRWAKRLILFWKADVVRGALLPAAVAVGQPAATLVNAALTAGISGTSFVWAPLYSTVVWGLQATVYDPMGSQYSSKDKFPVPSARFLPGLWATAGRAVAATVHGVGAGVKTVAHSLGFLGNKALAYTRLWGRTGLDKLFYEAWVKQSTLPNSENTLGLNLVSGPGVSSKFFFQLDPRTVAASVLASAELTELERFKLEKNGILKKPKRQLRGFRKYLNTLGQKDLTKEVDADVSKNVENLNEQFAQEAKILSDLTRLPEIYYQGRSKSVLGLIKLTRESLESALMLGAALANRYYAEVFKLFSENEKAAFWRSYGLKPEDWVGLAKKHLELVYGRAILMPLEETDKHLKIHVDSSSLKDVVDSVLDGVDQEDLTEKYKVVIDEPKKPELPAWPVTVGPYDMCRGLLLEQRGNDGPLFREGEELPPVDPSPEVLSQAKKPKSCCSNKRS